VTRRLIAIDGPAASGKSSTAARVAERLGWAHLDSGSLYRALTLAALDHLGDRGPQGWSGQRVVALAAQLPVRLVLRGSAIVPEVAGVDVEEALRSDAVTAEVSGLAALPDVRTWVNEQQRAAVTDHTGVVVDGRDIGTVVFPDAPLKVFLVAAPAERARRRLAQRGREPEAGEVAREAERLAARDHADATRLVAPLRPAPDAVVVDTTRLSLDEQVARIVALALECGLG
jgi:cytidylate kinase